MLINVKRIKHECVLVTEETVGITDFCHVSTRPYTTLSKAATMLINTVLCLKSLLLNCACGSGQELEHTQQIKCHLNSQKKKLNPSIKLELNIKARSVNVALE